MCGTWAAALQGERGADRIGRAMDRLEARGVRSMRHFLLGLRAEAELAEGRVDDARRSVAAAFAESDATGERFYRPQLEELRRTLTPTLVGAARAT